MEPTVQGPYKLEVEWTADATEEQKGIAADFIQSVLNVVNAPVEIAPCIEKMVVTRING